MGVYRPVIDTHLSSFPGAVVGFNTTNHTATEGESVLVCVTISSPNASVLSMSSVLGEFTVTESSGKCPFAVVILSLPQKRSLNIHVDIQMYLTLHDTAKMS